METSVNVAESSSEAMLNRGNYKWFPLGNTNKRLYNEYR